MLLFVNDDVFVEASLLRGLEEHWPSDDRVGAVVPDVWSERLRRSEAGCFVQSRFGILDTRQEALAGRTHIDYPCGAAVAIERRTLDRAGGWEELYAPGYWEDVDLGLTLQHLHLPVLAVPELQVRHVHGASFDALGHRRIRTLYERNRAMVSLKYAAPGRLPSTMLFLVLRGVHDRLRDPATAKGTWAACRSMRAVLKARRRLQVIVETWGGHESV